MNYVFGVDIGGTTVKLGLFDDIGTLLCKWEIPTRVSYRGEKILSDISQSIRDTMQRSGIAPDHVIGIGVGCAGAVDKNGTVHEPGNLGGGVFNIPELLGAKLNLPVKASNDVNVAALGEVWKGQSHNFQNVVVVALGTGVGGGIICDGRIIVGAGGVAGEIGHIHLEDNETEACGCGCRGCLEQYASATGIVRLARRRLEKDNQVSILRSIPQLSAKDVFDAVKANDPVAIEIAEQFGSYLGKGLAIVAATVNPEAFILGGGVSKAGDILFDYIKPAYQNYSFKGIQNVEFKLAVLGNDAGIYGAAGLFLT